MFSDMDSSRLSSSCFSKITNSICSFKVSIKSFPFVFENSHSNHWFCSNQWNPDGPQMPESGINVDLLRYYKLIILQLYLLHFSIKVTLDSFILEAKYSLLIIMTFFYYIRIEILIGQKFYSYRHIMRIHLNLLEKQVCEFFYQGLYWRWLIADSCIRQSPTFAVILQSW